MKVVFKESFLQRLGSQVNYISRHHPANARKFKNELITLIKTIPNNPYRFRKSIYFDIDEVRDLLFKGYTVVFRIAYSRIEVFGLVKHQQNPTDD